jgi:hypothetical protein
MSNGTRDILITGVDEVKALISRIPFGVWDALPKAVEAMMIPYARAMRSQLLQHRRGGFLRKSIVTRNTYYENNNVAFGVVGPDREFRGSWKGKTVRPKNYAHLLNYGTKPHHLRRKATGNYEAVAVRSAGGKRRTYFRTRQVYEGFGAMHPGAKPFPFRTLAEEAARSESLRLGAIVVNRAITETLRKRGQAA